MWYDWIEAVVDRVENCLGTLKFWIYQNITPLIALIVILFCLPFIIIFCIFSAVKDYLNAKV